MLRLQFAQRGSQLGPFYELHVAAMRDQGQDFLEHLCQSQVPESPGVYSQVTRHWDCQLDRTVVST